MASEVDLRYIWSGVGYHGDSMWQPELYKDDGEASLPWQVEAHRNLVLLYMGYGTEGSYKAPVCEYRWASCRCVDQVSVSSKVWILMWQAWCGSNERGTSDDDVAVGLYHPWTLVLKWSADFCLRDVVGIVSCLDISPKVIRRFLSSWCGLDCFIPGH